ncbi:MAG: hypothetical protein EPO32_05780 [Anaerolineae bacterium]|nr:MAG: hypothetical protein EPO32_05780 [Anaerolineae bacterium]
MKKQYALYSTLVVILLTSQACSNASPTPESGDATSTAIPGQGAAAPTAIPAPSEFAPTAIPEPLPSGYMALLQEKMASGDWTREEGLVTLLKVFAGEIQASEANLGEGVQETEGTGILTLASGYLDTGTDPAVKEEIIRLLSLLVPSQAALDQYSIPESEANRRGAGLAAPARQDEEACNLLWEDGFPDARTPVYPCFKHGDRVIDGHLYRVYYPLAWHGDHSRDEFYDATLAAVELSIDKYNDYGSVFPIYFVFSILPDERDTADMTIYASTDTRWFKQRPERPETEGPDTEACPVIINPAAMALGIAAFKQTIAHEIFHCFQAWNLERQFNGPGEDSWWWGDGTAEYFSNLVYPSTDAEYDFADSFNWMSQTDPLTTMSYENFVFFQFLGNTIGEEGVIALLRTLPTTPGRAAQLAALAAVPGMEETFEAFVRSVLDQTLMDSSGRLMHLKLPLDANDVVRFSDIGIRDFSAEPFVFARYIVIFDSEKSFAVETLSVGVGRSSWRAGATMGGWAPLPTPVTGGCEDLPYLMYVITTTPAAVRTESLAATSVTEAPCDECLLGRWEATNGSVLAYMQSIIAAGGEDVPTVESATGVMFLQFGSSGTGAGGYENLKIHETGVGGNANTEVFVTFEGFSSGPYTADGFEMVGLGQSTEIMVTVQIIANGVSVGTSTVPIGAEYALGSTIPTAYICDGDTLTTYPQLEGVVVEPIEWIHISP